MRFMGGNASFREWVFVDGDPGRDALVSIVKKYLVRMLDNDHEDDPVYLLEDEMNELFKQVVRKEFNAVLDGFPYFNLAPEGFTLELGFSEEMDDSNPRYFWSYKDIGEYYTIPKEFAGQIADGLRKMADAIEKNAE